MEQSPRNVDTTKADASFPTLLQDNAPPQIPAKKSVRRALCTKKGAARGVATASAVVLLAAGAVAQGFANTHFGVSEFMCWTGFAIFAALVAGHSFLTDPLYHS